VSPPCGRDSNAGINGSIGSRSSSGTNLKIIPQGGRSPHKTRLTSAGPPDTACGELPGDGQLGDAGQDTDTGSLRGDLLELLSRGIKRFHEVPGDTLRERLAQDEVLELIRPLLTRAAERGELRTDRCSDRVLRVPFDLLRGETLLYGTEIDDAAVLEIVDDIALPLLTLHCGTPAG
jgi:hypothetical protein